MKLSTSKSGLIYFFLNVSLITLSIRELISWSIADVEKITSTSFTSLFFDFVTNDEVD